jgi:hypothetical protein
LAAWEQQRKANKQSTAPKHRPTWLKHELALRDREIDERDRRRRRLPGLRDRERQFSDVLKEGRDYFYGGAGWLGQRKNLTAPFFHSTRGGDHVLRLRQAGRSAVRHTMRPLRPPNPPLPGTGSFEEALQEVQGIHWPDHHSPLPVSALLPPRVPGRFGGAIWDTQTAIEELAFKLRDLKVEVSGGSGGASAADGEAKRRAEELKDLQLERLREELAASRLSAANLGELTGFLGEFRGQMPFLGAFMQGTGGRRVGRSGVAILHEDEMITPSPKGPAGNQLAAGGQVKSGPVNVTLYIDGDAAPLMKKVRAEIDGQVVNIDKKIGRRGRQLSVAPGG